MTNPPPKPTHGRSGKLSQDEEASFRRIGHTPNDSPHRGSTHGHAVSSVQEPPSLSTSNSRPSAQPTRYVDRDDPRYGRSSQDASRHREHHKRRSRSPEARKEAAAEHLRTVPWKDLRAPRVDQSDRVSCEASSSRTSTPKPATTAVKKRFADDISRWNRKQSELHTSPTSDNARLSAHATQPSKQAASDSPTLHKDPSPDVSKLAEAELASYDYKDRERIACLLCQRKFKSIDTLHRHEAESQLHRDNLTSIDVCRQAVSRKLESSAEPSVKAEQGGGHAPRPSSSSWAVPLDRPEPSTPAYRDRASERRAVFGAETPSKHSDTDNRTKLFDGPSATVSVPIPQSAPARPIDSDNIGSKLLALMGWSQGQGLGAQREGRTDIIESKIYRPGAGLGSSGATETAAPASHAPSVAFSGYVDRAKDRARQRLAQHSRQNL